MDIGKEQLWVYKIVFMQYPKAYMVAVKHTKDRRSAYPANNLAGLNYIAFYN